MLFSMVENRDELVASRPCNCGVENLLPSLLRQARRKRRGECEIKRIEP
jgi:hypothetical protein